MYQNRLAAGLHPEPQGDIRRSPRLAKPQWAIRGGTIPQTPSRSYWRFAVGKGRERRTDRNGKVELEGGLGNFIMIIVARDFHVKMQKKHLAAGLRTDPTGKT